MTDRRPAPRGGPGSRTARISRIDPIGDAALLVTLGDELDLETNLHARRLTAALGLRVASRPGLGMPVPGHASVLVPFDPDVVGEAEVGDLIDACASAAPVAEPAAEGALHEITVSYGGADGLDLAEVAARTGLSEADVVRLHAGEEYRVLVLGFVPGFPYLGLLPEPLDLPRRATPRVRVPAGSVAIAGRQCGIYPLPTPGGWHLIGRTTALLWNPAADPPALLRPGDRVRFVPS